MAKLFSAKKTQTPDPTPPATMPDPQSPAIQEAKRRTMEQMMQRAGRQSTILSDAGGDSYSRKTLG